MSNEMQQAMNRVRYLYRVDKSKTWSRCIEIAARSFNVDQKELTNELKKERHRNRMEQIERESEKQRQLCKAGLARGRQLPQNNKYKAEDGKKYEPQGL